jgi:uncharacterized MAPEG superfamily protein
MKTQHIEATSGALRATRANTETHGAHGAGAERRGRTRHPSQGRSGLHTVASAAADNPRKTVPAFAAWAVTETFRLRGTNNLHTCIPLRVAA